MPVELCKEVAGLLARVHAIDPEWFEGAPRLRNKEKPTSVAGLRWVTVHGDFRGDNIVRGADGKLKVIDLENCGSAFAGQEIGCALLCIPVRHRLEFAKAYLQASGLPSTEQDARTLVVDGSLSCQTKKKKVKGAVAAVPVPAPAPANSPVFWRRGEAGCAEIDL